MTRLYYDSEFTGLHRETTLISIAFCSGQGAEFYAEFSDYAPEQCGDWLRDNVIAHTHWIAAGRTTPLVTVEGDTRLCFGNRELVRKELESWLGRFDAVEIWADCPAYDWVLFCDLFGGALQIPEQIYYIPFDLATAFKLHGLDPDTDRVEFAGVEQGARHNALHDARVARACHRRLLQETRNPPAVNR